MTVKTEAELAIPVQKTRQLQKLYVELYEQWPTVIYMPDDEFAVLKQYVDELHEPLRSVQIALADEWSDQHGGEEATAMFQTVFVPQRFKRAKRSYER